MLRSWWLAGLAFGTGVVAAGLQFGQHSPGTAVGLLVMVTVLATMVSPLAFPRSIGAAQATERSANDDRPIIYWRPGCSYCLRLRVRLGRDGARAHWVNIWNDPEGAAAVRAITGGNETVPTVVTAEQSFVNPNPGWLRTYLRAQPRID